jgi:hypothetical protein
MNPILAGVLVFFIVHVGMIAIHVVFTIILSYDIAISTGKTWMSPDEIKEELQKRWLGRVLDTTYPVAFWWALLWGRIAGDDND